MTDKPSAFIYSPALEKHSYPQGHPFNTIRAQKTREVLLSMGLLAGPDRIEVPPAPVDRLVLKKFHTPRYLHALQNCSKGEFDNEAMNMGLGTTDCPVFEGMYEYSVLAAGATITAARLIIDKKASAAFNPSGGFHHAGPEKASGFCYINDVALACYILAEHKKKVLYLDVDVHHGDGVVYAFYERNDVMTISLHQNPRTLFPGTGFEDEIGSGPGRGYCVNIPLPIGTYDEAYLHAIKTVVLPLIGAFKPDVFVFELGADALANDPLAHLRLTNNVYVDIIHYLQEFQKPILMTGGGGYNIENTVRAWSIAWATLCGADVELDANMLMGGIMLQTTEWQGGLRDRTLPITKHQNRSVMPALEETLERLKATIFPIHGL
ncbi:MAG: acetoin utilization protein AcuC [Sedimentisphaerales bacterium]|nr:acetoin utilization protein AcuC [Sedimentisphaerales bacterium]